MVFDAFAAAPGGQMDLATFRGLLGDLGLGDSEMLATVPDGLTADVL